MDNYYTKYLKYKNKYLKLKRANSGIIGGGSDGVIGSGGRVIMGGGVGSGGAGSGGVGSSGVVISGGNLGTELCPTTFGLYGYTPMDAWYYLREYDCNFTDINKKIPKKVEAITYKDFLSTNMKNPKKMITVQNLRERGFTKEFLLSKHFTEDVLNEVWLPLEKLQKLKKDRLSVIEIYIAETQEPNLIKISNEISSDKKLEELIMYDDINNKAEFKYYIGDLKNFFSIKDFNDVYKLLLIKKNPHGQYYTWYTTQNFVDAGLESYQVDKIYGTSKLEEKDNTVQLRNLKIGIDKLKSYGFSAKELKDGGFYIGHLKKAGFTAGDLIDAEFGLSDLARIGYNASQLKEVAFTARHLIDVGFSVKELIAAGFGVKDFKDAGYSAKELKVIGYTLEQLLDAGYDKDIINIIEKVDTNGLKGNHITAKELNDAGYSVKELKDAGYTLHDLIDAGYKKYIIDIIKKVDTNGLKGTHITIRELKLLGYSEDELKLLGYSEDELKLLGYSEDEL